jgi:hypothetical protein
MMAVCAVRAALLGWLFIHERKSLVEPADFFKELFG